MYMQVRERDESSEGHAFEFKNKSESDGYRVEHVKLC